MEEYKFGVQKEEVIEKTELQKLEDRVFEIRKRLFELNQKNLDLFNDPQGALDDIEEMINGCNQQKEMVAQIVKSRDEKRNAQGLKPTIG